MSFTKLENYVAIVIMALIFIVGITLVGVKLIANGNDLTDESKVYIMNLTQSYDNQGFDDISDTKADTSGSVNYLGEDSETGEQTDSDVFGLFKKALSVINKILSFVRIIFNFPTFLLNGLRLPVGEFNAFVNIFVYGLAIYGGIMTMKATNLGGNT